MSSTSGAPLDQEPIASVEDEILELEEKLAQAKARSEARNTGAVNGEARHGGSPPDTAIPRAPLLNETTHFLLLLSDSALPLGSFAFSSGLESYLAHARLNPFTPSLPPSSPFPSPAFDLFLPLSISSCASTALPFLLAAHRAPARLAELDDALDAAVICTVGRRASTAQGRALLGLWERSFAPSAPPCGADPAAPAALAGYARLLRCSPRDAAGSLALLPPAAAAAHLAPLMGVVARALSLSPGQAAYVFVLGHVKALVSAAVRANLMGPYAAQKTLASAATQDMIAAAIEREWDTEPENAGQGVPVMDLWVGRHEVLYSRIFNS